VETVTTVSDCCAPPSCPDDEMDNGNTCKMNLKNPVFVAGCVIGTIVILMVLWFVYIKFRKSPKTTKKNTVVTEEKRKHSEKTGEINQDEEGSVSGSSSDDEEERYLELAGSEAEANRSEPLLP
jgi:hypothetical protein